jgi:SRSO17 transposase
VPYRLCDWGLLKEHRPPTRAFCLKLSRSRWHIEQYFQRPNDDLDLDHFAGGSWRGFHHHLVLSALAYLFILTVYLRTKKNFWCDTEQMLRFELENGFETIRNSQERASTV